MAEVRLEIDVAHPPERVWQAFTDARLLREWFMPTDLEPREGGTFTLEPGELAGFLGPVSGELTELEPARRMVMVWQGEKLHTRVVWELTEIAGGCQVRMVQSGFIGAPATLRRRALRATYTRLFTEQLPGVLDRLAAAEVDAGGETDAGLRTAVPRQRRAPVAVATGWSAARWVQPAESLAQGTRSGGMVEAGPPAAGPGAPAADAAALAATTDVAGPRVTADPPDRGREPVVSVPAQRRAAEPTIDQPDPERSGPRAGGWLAPWRRRLVVLPGWGRAFAIGGAAAVLAVALLAAVSSQTPGPGAGPDGPPLGEGGERAGPEAGTQPGAAASRTDTADQPGASPGSGPDGAPGALPGPDGESGTDALDASGAPERPGPSGAGSSPAGPGPPESTGGPGDPPPPELTATMTTAASGLLGLGGRAVTVTVSNPGPGEAGTWEVSMDVADQEVTNVSGAAYTPDGSRAVFTPTGGGLATGDTSQFSFTLPGLLGIGASDPTDCTVDGRSCG